MNQNLIELVLILDRSGSMCGLEDDTIGGFNSMIEKEKTEEGDVVVSTVLFDDEKEIIHDRVKISEVAPLTRNEYYVRGCTALLDAVGTTIKRIETKHQELGDDAPGKTLVMITTDGYENASREYTLSTVKSLIEERKTAGWEFVFMGANIDAVGEATKLGIEADHAIKYEANSEGVRENYNMVDCCMKAMRRNTSVGAAIKKENDNK